MNIKTDYVSTAEKLQRAGFGLGRFNLLGGGVGLYLETGRACGHCQSSALLTDEITDSHLEENGSTPSVCCRS